MLSQPDPGAAREVPRARISPGLALWLLSASCFLFWVSLYVYVPTLPVYAKEGMGAAPSMVGAIIASYAIAQLLLRIPIGMGADTFGRKPFVIAGLIAAVAGAAAMAIAPGPWMLFAGRAITGVAAAVWVAFTVYFASSYTGGLARAMGILGLINGAAQISGSVTGGWVAEHFGWVAVFWFGAALGVVGTLLILPVPEARAAQRAPFSFKLLAEVLRTPLVVAASVIAVLTQFITYTTSFAFVPIVGATLGASKTQLGLITTVMFAASTAVSMLAVRMAGRWGYRMATALACATLVVASVAVPAVHSVSLLTLTQVVNGLGRGIAQVLLMSMAVRDVRPDQRATAMGVYQAVYAIGMLSGPAVGGVVAEWRGDNAVFWLCAAVALAATVATLVWPRIPGRRAGERRG